MRKRTWFLLLLVLPLLLVGLGIGLLVSMDLNPYRDRLAASLSNAVGEPVTLGGLRFTLKNGPAIGCKGLQIGSPGSDRPSLTARKLYLRVNFLPLLHGQLEFSQIILAGTQLDLPVASAEGQTLPKASSETLDGLGHWLEQARIDRLRLEEGTIRWLAAFPGSAPEELVSLSVNLALDDFRPGQLGRMQLSGVLANRQSSSPISLQGEVRFAEDLGRWTQWDIDLQGTIRNLVPRTWLALRDSSQGWNWNPGTIALGEIHLNGSLDDGLKIGLQAGGADLAISGEAYSRSVKLPQLQMSATWKRRVAEHRFENLRVNFGGLDLSGELDLSHPLEPQGRFDLHLSGRLPLDQAIRLLPDRKLPAELNLWLGRTRAGLLKLDEFSLNAPLSALSDTGVLLRSLETRADLDRLTLSLPRLGPVTIEAGQLRLTSGTVELKRAEWRTSGGKGHLSGQVSLLNPARTASFKMSGSLAAEELVGLLPENWTNLPSISGNLPVELTLENLSGQPRAELSATLEQLQVGFPPYFDKPAGTPGTLSAAVSLAGAMLKVERADIELGRTRLAASGTLATREADRSRLDIKISAGDLQSDRRFSPLLQGFEIRGGISGMLQLSHSAGQTDWSSDLLLEDVGVHLTRVIADVQRINGHVRLDGRGLEAPELQARLGDSPLSLQVAIADLASPQVRLQVKAPKLRAHELIFPNPDAWLRDVDGRLLIDSSGITFETVDVRLDGGTRAQVRGKMHGYHGPRVNLDIDAGYGNINEVIALWHSTEPPPPHDPSRPPTTVEINIHAEQGKIHDFSFDDAACLLRSNGQGQLVLFPLNFHKGGGYGVGQVTVDSSGPGPSRLKVSGHVEGMTAQPVYQQLLHRSSLVTGTLRGDFYLEGETGDFFRTSNGGINLVVRDGVLKKFKLLSKLFSLLNVSQIFSLQLPDMATEGMPFDSLEGTAQLREGVISTEDLLIHSRAMDLGLITALDLHNGALNGVLAVKPLKTLDNVLSKIPLAGWILTGQDKALITAQFTISGDIDNPEVLPAPAETLSRPVLGIIKRVFQLPGHFVGSLGEALEGRDAAPETEEPPN